jgi:hypothetical protein
MPIESHCPGCGTKVRVPETLLGKSVKCPKCQMVFTAEAPTNAGFEEVVEEERPRRSRRPEPVDDYDDEPAEDDYEPRPRRGGNVRRRALQAVSVPAGGLMAAGILGIVGNIAYIILTVALLGAAPKVRPGMPPGMPQGQVQQVQGAELVGRMVGSVVGIALSGVLIACAAKMKRLESKGAALTACILGMLPCGGCCLVGLPFGIWGIVVLNNPDVKRALG